MNKVKKVVAAAALQFSVHTDELTRSIQGLPCFFTAALEYAEKTIFVQLAVDTTHVRTCSW